MRRKLFLSSLAALLMVTAYLATGPAAAGNQETKPAEVKINPKTFDDYVGQYATPTNPDVVLSFFRDVEHYYVQATNGPPIEIFPAGELKFFVKSFDAQVDFVRDAQAKITGMVWHQEGRTTNLNKISNQPLAQKNVPFDRREEMIRMRDGVRLHTLIFTPKSQSENLPMLMERTPYGIGDNNSDSINGRFREFIPDGYVFVLQDIRGRYGSEGQFVMNRPMHDKKDKNGIDESTDTYDTIDWLTKNVRSNNGRVGILGVSYDGWLSAVATIDAHPALKASSPQAPMTDTWLGDDFFHNGAFRQSYGYEYVKAMETSKEDTDVSFDKDAYDWYLELGSLAKITELGGGAWPTWNAFVAHPNYDDYWQA